MDEDQAADIVDHLLIAAYELDEAKAAANILADHDKDAASVRDLVIKLNSELLQAMFQRFPDLLRFDEFPEINSSLRWDQVRLPPSVSETQVDQIILSVNVPRWHKMARIIWDAVKRGEERGSALPTKCSLPAFRSWLKLGASNVRAISVNGAIAKCG